MTQLTITDILRNLNHWGLVIYNQIVTWTAKTILAMFVLNIDMKKPNCWFWDFELLETIMRDVSKFGEKLTSNQLFRNCTNFPISALDL